MGASVRGVRGVRGVRVLCLGLALLMLGHLPVGASTATVTITDVADDANGINGQGEKGFGPVNYPTAHGSIAEADIRRVKLRPRFRADGTTRNGFTVALTTTGVPQGGRAQYWLDGVVGDRCSRVLLYHHPGSLSHEASTSISFNCGDGDVHEAELAPARVKNRTLLIRVPAKALPDWIDSSHQLSRIWVETRGGLGLANVLDTAATNTTFPLG